MTNWRDVPCVTSQPGPWDDDDDALYEMAEQAWNGCWPDEPRKCVSKATQRVLDRDWLVEAAKNIIYQYDGPVSDIADHIGDFGDKWIEMKAEALLEDARHDADEARADAAADRDLFDREDW